MRFKIITAAVVALISLSALRAQVPGPATQPAPPNAMSLAPGSGGEQDAAAKAALVQALQKLKAANDDILKRQLATLKQMDDLAKAAEEMKVFTLRR